MRKELFPKMYEAYKDWCKTKDLSIIKLLANAGEDWWFSLGMEALKTYMSEGEQGQKEIEELIENSQQPF